jgi:hypothetical protein
MKTKIFSLFLMSVFLFSIGAVAVEAKLTDTYFIKFAKTNEVIGEDKADKRAASCHKVNNFIFDNPEYKSSMYKDFINSTGCYFQKQIKETVYSIKKDKDGKKRYHWETINKTRVKVPSLVTDRVTRWIPVELNL